MTPQTEQELADVIASAKGPLRISGGGTRPIGNPVVGEALSTSGLSGISLYEPGALTIVAQAGTPVAEIEAAYAAAATPSRTGHPSTTTACRPQA
jgi:glycolate oxidase FAD binding subunit